MSVVDFAVISCLVGIVGYTFGVRNTQNQNKKRSNCNKQTKAQIINKACCFHRAGIYKKFR